MAFLARADNPVDALAASSIAGMLGSPVLLTSSTQLSLAARSGLSEYEPDLVVLAGGPEALSSRVEDQVNDAGYHTRRVAGSDRTSTAFELSKLVREYGLGRPFLTDVQSSGSLVAKDITAQTIEAEDLSVAGAPPLTGLIEVRPSVSLSPNEGWAFAQALCPEGTVAISGSAHIVTVFPRPDVSLQSNGRPGPEVRYHERRWNFQWSYDSSKGDPGITDVVAFCVKS